MIFSPTYSKEIFVHVGFMKTGSSAIQGYLKDNSAKLGQHGILYPKVNQQAMNYLGFCLLDKVPPRVHHLMSVSRDKLYKELLGEMKSSTCNKIILSTEAWHLISTNLFIGELGPRRLHHYLNKKGWSVRIVAYIRRQDEYLESQYNQHIKTHNFWDDFSGTIDEFYELKKPLFDFKTVLERWAKVFGSDNIDLGIYSEDVDIIKDFMKKIKPDFVDDCVYPRVNEKLNVTALEFLRRVNGLGISRSTMEGNYELVELAKKHLEEKGNSASAIISADLAKRVMEENLEKNREVSDSYLSNHSWYADSKEDKYSQSINKPELKVEELLNLTVELWNKYYNQKYG